MQTEHHNDTAGVAVTPERHHPPASPSSPPPAPAAVHDALSLLEQAEAKLLSMLPPPPVLQRVVITSDILYQAFSGLFPAERMLVIAGLEVDATTLRLGAAFDVTDEGDGTHYVHVRANPDKLGQALKLMDYSGTALGAWVHSHPGLGIGATIPSSIDTAQHARWLRHYPAHLISIIMVKDGYFRCFGSAIESGHVLLQIAGAGIVQEDTHVYRLTQER